MKLEASQMNISDESQKWFVIRAAVAIPVVVFLIVVCEGARERAKLDAAERWPLRYKKPHCTPVGELDSCAKVIFETGTVTFKLQYGEMRVETFYGR